MYKAFLIKYAEIGVKGKNRDLFEEALVRQIKYALKRCEGEFRVRRTRGRIYIDVLSDDYDYEETIDNLKTVCGVSAICPMVQLEDEGFDKLCESAVSYMDEHYSDKNVTFKVNARHWPLCAVAGPAAKHPPCVHPSHLADQRVLRHSRRPGAGGLRLGQPRGAERGIRGTKRICGHYAPVAAGIKSKQSGMAFGR